MCIMMVRYFTYQGRADRGEFAAILIIAASILAGIVTITHFAPYPSNPTRAVLAISFGLLILAFVLLAAVRRLHDLDKSGQWMWIFAGVPVALEQLHGRLPHGYGPPATVFVEAGILIWGIVTLVFTNGTDGPNRFGPDPRQATA
jgi:uncharacterized membrane protein YhaH (DUF805 family)